VILQQYLHLRSWDVTATLTRLEVSDDFEGREPPSPYAEQRLLKGVNKYAIQLLGLLKAEASEPCKRRRNLSGGISI
jgi:hypothetical protein